ncbi:MAG: hypothetical protein IPP55_17010 [Anaerolineales bacterium]|nr:hypothetical protein [Anaerolineales bacterium]
MSISPHTLPIANFDYPDILRLPTAEISPASMQAGTLIYTNWLCGGVGSPMLLGAMMPCLTLPRKTPHF